MVYAILKPQCGNLCRVVPVVEDSLGPIRLSGPFVVPYWEPFSKWYVREDGDVDTRPHENYEEAVCLVQADEPPYVVHGRAYVRTKNQKWRITLPEGKNG